MKLKFWESRATGASHLFMTSNDDSYLSGGSPINVPAVMSATQLISGSISGASLGLYLKNGEPLERNKLDKLLKEPMSGVSGQYWLRMVVMDILQYGNAFCQIVGSLNDIQELRYIKYSSCSVMVDVYTGKPLYYNITPADGGTIKKLPYYDVLHFRGTPDSAISPFVGRNVLRDFAGVLSYDTELRSKTLAWVKNLVRPSVILSTPKNLKAETVTALRKNLSTILSGDNFGKTAVMADGAKLETIDIKGSLVDGDVAVLQKANAADIYNLFGLDPAILNSEHSKYASFQQLQASMLRTCFNAIMVSIEGELNVKLLLSDAFEFRFDRSGFVKGDVEAYSSMILDQLERELIDVETARVKLGYSPKMNIKAKADVKPE